MSGEHDAYVNAISTHTFLWPFTFKGENTEECPFVFDKYNPQKTPSDAWVMDEGLESRDKKADSFLDAYMKAQYFNRLARDIFAGGPESSADADPAEGTDPSSKAAPPCTRFRYSVQGLRYLIKGKAKYQGELIEYDYELPIHQIRLFLFHPCGVGVLSIETYNQKYTDLADITRINDFGRRIRLPYMPRKDGGLILCADRLGIIGEHGEHCANFREKAETPPEDTKELLDPPSFIYDLLGGTLEAGDQLDEKTAKVKKIKKTVLPASDDRMFLVSLVKAPELSESAKRLEQLLYNDKPDTKVDTKQWERDMLYATVFADSDGPTCQDARMQKEILRKTIYPRWSRYGTLYATTNLSVMCLTANDKDWKEESKITDSVYRPFLTEYTDMTVLVLAQRVSIEHFAKKASDNVSGAEEQGLLKQRHIEKIIDLHERYVTWQNRINLFEVTDQEQGIEVYGRMREQMGVNGRIDDLAEQLEDMYSIANVDQTTKTNDIVKKFAVISIVVALFTFMATFVLELTEGGKHFLQDCNQHIGLNAPWMQIFMSWLPTDFVHNWTGVVVYLLQFFSIFAGIAAIWYAHSAYPQWLEILMKKDSEE